MRLIKRKVIVYVASPYSLGVVSDNVRRSLEVTDRLMSLGYLVFAPLLTHFQTLLFPRPEEEWVDYDLDWVAKCDVVLRLDGDSRGADGEVAYAKDLGIPVVYSLDDLLKVRPPKKEVPSAD